MATWPSETEAPAAGPVGGPDAALGFDVVVVGAGPAGMAAAVAASGHGARVAMVDGEARTGGQFWRHGPGGVGVHHHGRRRWTQLAAAVDSAQGRGALVHLAGHRVWRVEPQTTGRPTGQARTGEADGVLVHAVRTGPDGAQHPVTLHGRSVVLAPGAHDRVLPFPGWDTPGVLTPGAVQALLKEHGVVAGRRVVVGGTGPFLLPVAVGLAEAGARVVALAEAADGAGWLRGAPAVAGAPDLVREGLGYAAGLARHRIPVLPRHAVVRVLGDGRVEAAVLGRLGRDWQVVPGSEREVECDTVAVGWGFLARLELAVVAGCSTTTGPEGTPAVAVDAHGRTSVPAVLAAGELTGVAGARLAVLGGLVAGAAAADVARGREPAPVPAAVGRSRARLGRFATAMHAAHPVRPGWSGWLEPDTVLCRCEEITVAAVRSAVDDLGATDLRSAKLLTRCGMGWCQGRMCAEATATVVASALGVPLDGAELSDQLAAAASRPVAVPVRLGALLEPGPGPERAPGTSTSGTSTTGTSTSGGADG